ncbi:unnamed protein product [Dibothriocephalus latus]|uniref:Uncharacterized protein n=1 Tax=Dibothriocephalus latus TaxID=60516 RepID=A0A3P7P025_DIBLA|nr:unnamed protein product [Dibothriocephalus latus]
MNGTVLNIKPSTSMIVASSGIRLEQIIPDLKARQAIPKTLDSERKVQLAQLEARLQVAERRLAAYNQMEEELDRVIEASAEQILDDMPADDGKVTSRTLLKIANLGVLPVTANGQVPSTGPLLPTLATRRLEHCLQLSRKLAETERAQYKPAGYLANALTERDIRLADMQQQKTKAEYRLRRLYKFTKEIVQERNAMVADIERHIHQRQTASTSNEYPTEDRVSSRRQLCFQNPPLPSPPNGNEKDDNQDDAPYSSGMWSFGSPPHNDRQPDGSGLRRKVFGTSC